MSDESGSVGAGTHTDRQGGAASGAPDGSTYPWLCVQPECFAFDDDVPCPCVVGKPLPADASASAPHARQESTATPRWTEWPSREWVPCDKCQDENLMCDESCAPLPWESAADAARKIRERFIENAHAGNGTGCRCCDLVDEGILDRLLADLAAAEREASAAVDAAEEAQMRALTAGRKRDEAETLAARFRDAWHAAERREEQLREAHLKVEDGMIVLYVNGEPDTNYGFGLGLGQVIDRVAALADVGGEQQGSDDECICSRLSDLPDGTIIADLTCPVHGVEGSDPGDVLPGAVSRGDKPT